MVNKIIAKVIKYLIFSLPTWYVWNYIIASLFDFSGISLILIVAAYFLIDLSLTLIFGENSSIVKVDVDLKINEDEENA